MLALPHARHVAMSGTDSSPLASHSPLVHVEYGNTFRHDGGAEGGGGGGGGGCGSGGAGLHAGFRQTRRQFAWVDVPLAVLK